MQVEHITIAIEEISCEILAFCLGCDAAQEEGDMCLDDHSCSVLSVGVLLLSLEVTLLPISGVAAYLSNLVYSGRYTTLNVEL